ncbi:MAG: hypothetical protein M1833_001834 [Piccolia ochrophora]|nr:MAG: hypothetical protein M1833_001834 [Piccolia ochrophora]
MDFSTEAEGALVPSQREVQHIDLSDAHWLLMVEKEATFRSLAAGKAWDHPIIGKGVIVTAKGYPDIATRSFLRLLSTAACATGNPPPLYALVDYDPDGIAILSTYKYGSIALAHENASLIAPTMQWIGVQSSDLLPHNAEAASNENSNKSQQLRPLTARDRRLARKLLEKEIYAEDGPELEWRREVQVMLILGVKAEIQIMSGGGRDAALKEWLERKITATSLTEFWRLASERA